MKRNSNLTKKELKIRQKGTLLCQNCVGEIKKLLRKPLDRFRDRLVSFCGKASGVNCPVARSFVVEAKFVYLAPKLGSFFSTGNFYSPPND